MRNLVYALLIASFTLIPAMAETPANYTPVVATPNADALFTSDDPRLHENKQVVYHILKDLLEANQWDLADQYIADDYIQHNPNAANGLDSLVYFFTDVLQVEPSPIPEKLGTPVSEVMAEGDLVTVIYPRRAEGPNGSYTTAWFDTWRIEDGKATEHWDPALLNEAPQLSE